jgi:threonine dehydrogenase-like Zn-dependent dehydrogenase
VDHTDRTTALSVVLAGPDDPRVERIPVPRVGDDAVRVRPACRAGRENICANVQHIGHATGWGEMDYYPGGMAEEFEVWPGFAYPIPERISFDEATFLDVTDEYDAIVDTIGTPETVVAALRALRPGGALALLAVHDGEITVNQLALSGERLVTRSANNPYGDFEGAIGLMSGGEVNVKSLVTHRFPVSRAAEVFEVMANKDRTGAYKIVLHA